MNDDDLAHQQYWHCLLTYYLGHPFLLRIDGGKTGLHENFVHHPFSLFQFYDHFRVLASGSQSYHFHHPYL
jgi:hypothetical protein